MTTDQDPTATGQGETAPARRQQRPPVDIKMPDDQPGAQDRAHTMAAVEDMLGRLMNRLDDNDRRYNTALDDLNQRLNEISERTRNAPPPEDAAAGATLDRLRDQANSLAAQVNEAGNTRQEFTRPPVYASEDRPQADLGDTRLNSSFANVTQRLEKSLSSTAPAGELDIITHRLDDLGRRLDQAIARPNDAAALQTIERQLHALSAGFGEVRQNHARVEAIEENLSRLMQWAQSGGEQPNGRSDRLDSIEKALGALDSHAREMDARTVRTLEAMNDALHTIAERADRLKPQRAARDEAEQIPADAGSDAEPLSDVWIEERPHASLDEDAGRLEAEIGASIPDYQPAPENRQKDVRSSRRSKPAPDSENDFIEAARRAAEAAARAPAQESRRGKLSERLAGSIAGRHADEAQKPRRILYLLAAGLMLTSAGLMYARMSSQAPVHDGGATGQQVVPPTSTAPVPQKHPRSSEAPRNAPPVPAVIPQSPEKRSERMQAITPTRASARAPELATDAGKAVEPAKPKQAALKSDGPISTATLLASLTPPAKDPMEGVTFDIKEPERAPAKRTQSSTTNAMLVPGTGAERTSSLGQPKRMPAPKPPVRSENARSGPSAAKTAPNRNIRKPARPAGSMMSMPPARIGPNSLRVAAARGNPAAQVEIASRFAKGTGVPKDLKKAAEWYGRAATQGYAPAQYRLAALFERGQGVKQNLDVAHSWYRRAAEGGNVRSMHNLAVLYTRDLGKGRNYSSARNWFYQAARHGLADSQFNLGILYESGLGVRKNTAEAYKWFTLAARQGDAESAKRREAIRPVLPSKSLAAAENAIRKWRPVKPKEDANHSGPPPGGWRNAAISQGKAEAQPDDIRRAQHLLNRLGYDAGVPDGKLGPQTQAAIRRFQSRTGIAQTGSLSPEMIKRLERLAS